MTMKVLCFSLNSPSSYYKDRASNPYDFGVRLTKLATKIHLTISIFILLISFFFSIIVLKSGIFLSFCVYSFTVIIHIVLISTMLACNSFRLYKANFCICNN